MKRRKRPKRRPEIAVDAAGAPVPCPKCGRPVEVAKLLEADRNEHNREVPCYRCVPCRIAASHTEGIEDLWREGEGEPLLDRLAKDAEDGRRELRFLNDEMGGTQRMTLF